jgi:hypothetical protein
LLEANGATADANAQDPTAAQYTAIGVNGVDAAAEEALLGEVIGNTTASDVDTVAKVQALADAAQAVMDVAALTNSPTVPDAFEADNTVFSAFASQLQTLGLTGINPENAGAIWAAVRDSANDGSQVDTLGKLQALINAANDRPTLVRSTFMLDAVEDTPLTISVASMLSSANVTDGDTGASFSGIAIHWNQANAAQGTWQWSTSGTDGWTDLPSDLSTNSPESSFWLNASDFLRFVPTAHYNQNANSTADGKVFPLLLRIGDDTMPATVSGDRVDALQLNKSGQPLTDASMALHLQVAPVNDAPTLVASSSNPTFTEGDGNAQGAAVSLFSRDRKSVV